jgi:hypothetical protein
MMLAPLLERGLVKWVSMEARFWNASRIFLRHCFTASDMYNYQGAEIHLVLVDELSRFTAEIYRFLRSRVRYVTADEHWKHLLPRIICAANPGNVGHSFVKRTWVDHKPFEVWQAPDNDGGLTRAFIPARISDNPFLLKSDPDYRKRLEGLGDPLLVRAFLRGRLERRCRYYVW